MSIVEVSSRDFRDKQRAMFDLADRGEQIVITRRRKRSYILTPVQDDDLELSPELVATIERGLQNIREGKTVRYTTMEDFRVQMGL